MTETMDITCVVDCANVQNCVYASAISEPAREFVARQVVGGLNPRLELPPSDAEAAINSSETIVRVNGHFAAGKGCEFIKTGICEAAIFLLRAEPEQTD